MSRRHTTTALVTILAMLLLMAVPAGAAEVNLAAFRNSTGISHHPLAASNFDGGGFSYSRAALLLEGIDRGTRVTVDGLDYTWPSTEPGQADNVEMNGQLIPVLATGATRIGLLGAAHNGPVTAPLRLHYSAVVDGERKDVVVSQPITFSDWTLAAGGAQPSPGNTIAVSTRFRVNGSTVDQVRTHVFATSVPIDPGMELQAIELPSEGRIHIFSLALG